MIEITVTAEGQEPRKHRFEESHLRIGRDHDNDLVLDSQGCSRHHAEIVRDAAGYRLVDLGSTNGVLLGSQVVRDVPLFDGVEVTIGTHRLAFALPDQKAAEATMLLSYRPGARLPGAAPVPARPSAPEPPLYLVVGGESRERYLKVVPGAEYILGRSPSADLVIDDHKCSKQHALVYVRDGCFRIVDLQSSNGTFVNSERIRESPLSPGDDIVIGHTTIQVKDQILDIVDQANLLERTSLGRITVPAEDEKPRPEGTLRRSGQNAGRLGVRRRREVVHTLLVALAIAAVLAVAVGSYFGSRWQEIPNAGPESSGLRQPGETGRLVQVKPVESRELVFDLSGTGSVKAQRTVTVSAEVAALVLELAVEEGAAVEQGALLVRLNDRDIRHRIEAARASVSAEQVTLSREDYLRKERLFNDEAVVRSVYEQAKNRYLTLDSTFRSTQATISQLEGQLAKTRISAPASGVATRIFVEEGEFVGPGSPLVTLDNMDEVQVQVELADRDFVRISPGQPVEATAGAFPGEVFRGEVARLGSVADPVTRTFEIEARLRNPGLRLRPGLIVSVRIILGRERGLVVPAKAVVEKPGTLSLVFLARDGVARLVEVRLGRRLDREVQVLAGLSEGDDVIVVGHELLVDGQAIEPYRKP